MDARSVGALGQWSGDETPAGQEIRLLVATQVERVCDILEARHDVRYDFSLFPDVIINLLPQAEVIIIDYEDVGGSEADKVRLQEEIFAARNAGRIDEYTSEEFLANPNACLEGTGAFGRMRRLRPNCCIAFVSYSGGTGRTTLALDTAFYFAETLRKYAQKRAASRSSEGERAAAALRADTMLVEMTFGVSSVAAATGLEMPHLMELTVDSDVHAQTYRGVDLVPMDYENVRVLAVDLLRRYFERELSCHRFTVVDTIWPHSLSEALAEHVDLWLVVATERPDTIANAAKLADELRAEYGPDKVWLVQNCCVQSKSASGQRASGRRSRRRQREQETGDSEERDALERGAVAGQVASGPRDLGLEWHIRVPSVARPDEYRGELGRAVLSQIFAPVWQEYDKPRKAGLLG